MLPTQIPVCLPKLPTCEHIVPYLKKIDANRWYSNFGPLHSEFIARLAQLFAVTPRQTVLATSGTLLLELCIKAMGIPAETLCIMPAWTFVATPLAAVAAGLNPYFIDVDVESQTIDPVQLELSLASISRFRKIGMVIVTSPFGKPVDVSAWDAFTERTGVPVLIDAAASFDSAMLSAQMKIAKTPMMISLHATKVFGIGEGSVLFSTDEELVYKIEQLSRFGFPNGERCAHYLGTNAKMSEYQAAVGLAAIDIWANTRDAWKQVTNYYITALEEAGIGHMLSTDWVTSTCNIIIPDLADAILNELGVSNIPTRKWWGNGCQHQPAFNDTPRERELENTEYLQQSVLGLPFYLDMTSEQIDKVMLSLTSAIEKHTAEKLVKYS